MAFRAYRDRVYGKDMDKFFRTRLLIPPKWICLFCVMVYVFLTFRSQAQNRGIDRIVTVRNDTMEAKIADVGLEFLKYRNFKGDTTILRTISKREVRKVIYGNGEMEEVSDPGMYFNEVPKTRYQKEIEGWLTNKLLKERAFYKPRFRLQKATGMTAFVIAGGLQIFGATQLLISISNRSNEANGTVPILTGIGMGAVIGMPLTYFGIRNRQKYRALTNELRTRGIGDARVSN